MFALDNPTLLSSLGSPVPFLLPSTLFHRFLQDWFGELSTSQQLASALIAGSQWESSTTIPHSPSLCFLATPLKTFSQWEPPISLTPKNLQWDPPLSLTPPSPLSSVLSTSLWYIQALESG